MSDLVDPVAQAARDADRHWYEDGLENIYRGILLLLFSLDYVSHPGEPPHPSTETTEYIFRICDFLLFLLLVLSHPRLIVWMKSKLTYPRTGYVAPPPIAVGIKRYDTGFWPAPLPTPREEEYLDRQQRIHIGYYLLLAMPYVLLLLLPPVHRTFIDRGMALGLAAFLGVYSMYTQPAGRPAWTSLVLCVAAGIAVVLLPIPGIRPGYLLYPILGGISTAVGLLQLTAFLLRHPRPKPTES